MFVPRIQKLGYDIAVSAFYGLHGCVLNWNGIQVYPGGYHNYGQDAASAHAAHFGADVMITLMDAWVCEPHQYGHGVRWCVTEDTLITMADGSQKPIRDIRIGDQILGSDDGIVTISTVKETQTIPSRESGQLLRITTANGDVLDITADNAVWASQQESSPKWIPAESLSVGDVVYCQCTVPSTTGGSDATGLDQGRVSVSQRKRRHKDVRRNRQRFRAIHHQRAETSYAARNKSELCGSGAIDELHLPGSDSLSNRVSGGIGGRRGHDLNSQSQTQPRTSEWRNTTATECCDRWHRPELVGVLDSDAWSEGPYTTASYEEQQTDMADRMVRVPVLPTVESSSSLSVGQKGTSADCVGVSGESYQPRHLQSELHGPRDSVVRANSWLEPTRIVGLEVRTSPEFVYDLTTTTSNFFASNILIHNCPWFPIDSEPLPRRIYDAVSKSFQPIVFSRFGQKVAQDMDLDVAYVPHAIDTSVLRPMDRKQAREALGFDQDRFIVGMVAANKGNPSRKAFTEQLLAYRMFKDRHPDAFLYLHTTTGQRGELGGENLVNYLASLGLELGKDVIFADQYTMLLGFGDDYMRCMYNALDVLLSVSKGEGFGIPILESQACGTPVIVGDWTAMSELCLAGWKVPKSEAVPWWNPLETYQYIPRPPAIAACLDQAYEAWGDKKLRAKARKRAMAYDADHVAEKYWKPVLAEIEARIGGMALQEAAD